MYVCCRLSDRRLRRHQAAIKCTEETSGCHSCSSEEQQRRRLLLSFPSELATFILPTLFSCCWATDYLELPDLGRCDLASVSVAANGTPAAVQDGEVCASLKPVELLLVTIYHVCTELIDPASCWCKLTCSEAWVAALGLLREASSALHCCHSPDTL